MPIRPENRARYGADWPEFSARLREECPACEWCRKPNGARVEVLARGWWRRVRPDDEGGFVPLTPWVDEHGQIAPALEGVTYRGRVIRVVLTVAHLNHEPEDRRRESLAVLCQRCHNRHDAAHRTATRAVTVRRRRAERDRQRRATAPQAELPGVVDGEIFDDKWFASNVWHDVCS